MNKRLQKRHERQVARAKERAKVSEPDVRTPEEIREARERSHSIRDQRIDHRAPYAAPPLQKPAAPSADGTPEADEKP